MQYNFDFTGTPLTHTVFMNAGLHIIPANPEEVFRREENDDLAMYLMRSPATDISESFEIIALPYSPAKKFRKSAGILLAKPMLSPRDSLIAPSSFLSN